MQLEALPRPICRASSELRSVYVENERLSICLIAFSLIILLFIILRFGNLVLYLRYSDSENGMFFWYA